MLRKTLVVLSCVALLSLGSAAMAVNIEWVTVGDPCNSSDTRIMSDGTIGYGRVDKVYRIGKYEVTNSQYCEFLNAVAAMDTYELYLDGMGNPSYHGGIIRNGSPEDYSYDLKLGYEQKPINLLTWASALRFANWLHNGQPEGDQNNSTTEDGAYDLDGTRTRKAGAQVFLPSEDEWYKAAFYKGNGTNSGYWNYATESDIVPAAEAPPGGLNSANYDQPSSGGPTDVGAYSSSLSAYGTFDQNGNLWEWNETIIPEWNGESISPYYRSLWGGNWSVPSEELHATFRLVAPEVNFDHVAVGFRVASVPEPTTLSLLAVSGLAVMLRRRSKSL